MIPLAAVLARLPALDQQLLYAWVAEDWVRPTRQGPELLFAEIDVARLTLILELRELEIGASAMPVVLSLLDQMHQHRRELRRLAAALQQAGIDLATLELPDRVP